MRNVMRSNIKTVSDKCYCSGIGTIIKLPNNTFMVECTACGEQTSRCKSEHEAKQAWKKMMLGGNDEN